MAFLDLPNALKDVKRSNWRKRRSDGRQSCMLRSMLMQLNKSINAVFPLPKQTSFGLNESLLRY